MALPIKILVILAGSLGMLFMGGITMMVGQQWMLVNVETHGPDALSLYIPVPVGLAYPFLGFIPEEAREIEIPPDVQLQPEYLKKMVEVLQDCPDVEFVRVSTPSEQVSISKVDDELVIHVLTEDEEVNVKVPFAFLEEALNGIEGNKIYPARMATALSTIRHSRFVSVKSADADVTIWSW